MLCICDLETFPTFTLLQVNELSMTPAHGMHEASNSRARNLDARGHARAEKGTFKRPDLTVNRAKLRTY